MSQAIGVPIEFHVFFPRIYGVQFEIYTRTHYIMFAIRRCTALFTARREHRSRLHDPDISGQMDS